MNWFPLSAAPIGKDILAWHPTLDCPVLMRLQKIGGIWIGLETRSEVLDERPQDEDGWMWTPIEEPMRFNEPERTP